MLEASEREMELIARQGWNDDTMLTLLRRFVDSRGLYAAYEEYLEDVANEENAECREGAEEDEEDEDYIELGGEG